MKILTLFLSLIIFSHCTNDNKIQIAKSEIKKDTIVIKKTLTSEKNNSFPIQTIKEIEYFVSVNNKDSNLKYIFSKRNDGKVIIRRNFDFPNLPQQKSVFKFDELKYVLQEAKNEFKIDSLNYLIYGSLDSAKNMDAVEKITKEFIESKGGKSNISTKDYGKISEFILKSDIAGQINSELSIFSMKITKISIEKAFLYKPNKDSKEIINCFVVMSIEKK